MAAMSYNNDKSSEVEYGMDPASGGFFNSDYKKHDDLKQMLDINKDSMKLEAMKRIIGMMAKGRDASDLFPAVVKNVVSKNIEIKKLVYVYLARYAEEQQDLALLSISTFQRALKDPNQLIRASALRVLSSIRVPMIIPIVMMAIKDSSLDMSPYVRKTAAHAIPKLYSLDPEQKEELVLVIHKLLQDKTTLVVGSAVMAFEEVCPERISMIHKNFRKLCNLLVDVDEWGQVIILNMLTRYARTQFTDPNLNNDSDDDDVDDSGKPFYEDETEEKCDTEKKSSPPLDEDHQLLLKNAKPLFQSRNAAVVMCVAQLFHHLAPKKEVPIIAKALVRLLRCSREVQSVVLSTIVSLSVKRKSLFIPYLKSFFVRSSDPTHVKLLKLDILTTLASEDSISSILREFQTYISSTDKIFVAATVQAIGKCASNISQVTDTCLNGLVSLLSNRDEAVVAESVVVIKILLQTQPQTHTDIIKHMVRLTDSITVAQARAAILWLLGEYSHLVPKLGPDVLRKMAKSFIQEADIVKLQILNLAVKLYLTNASQTNFLCQYVLTLARYDENYDIRDRSRFLRQLLFPNANSTQTRFMKYAKQIFLAPKPAPIVQSSYHDDDQFQLGSLSHHIKSKAAGYHDLPPFATNPPDPNLRTPSTPPLSTHGRESESSMTSNKAKHSSNSKKSFYESDEESTSGPEESDSNEEDKDEFDGEDNDGTEEDTGSEEESSSDEDDQTSSSESESDQEPVVKPKKMSTPQPNKSKNKSTPDVNSNSTSKKTTAPQSNLDLLLDLEDFSSSVGMPLITPTLGGFLTPSTPGVNVNLGIVSIPAIFTPPKYIEVLNKISSGRGMISAQASFTRSPHIASSQLISISLRIQNCHNTALIKVRIENAQLAYGMSLHPFSEISSISPGVSVETTFGVNFNDSTQPITPKLLWEVDGEQEIYSAPIKFNAPAGELIKAVSMSVQQFDVEKGKLTGMNEHKGALSSDHKPISLCSIYEVANLGPIASEDCILKLAGQSVSSNCLVLLSIKDTLVTVNCEKMVLGSMLLNEILKHFN